MKTEPETHINEMRILIRAGSLIHDLLRDPDLNCDAYWFLESVKSYLWDRFDIEDQFCSIALSAVAVDS